MSDLVLHVKGKYFVDIKAGTKRLEYRLQTDYWRKRLVGREYEQVVICLGYPGANDHRRRITFPWRGYEEKTITHEHFGPELVRVFAIKLEMEGKL